MNTFSCMKIPEYIQTYVELFSPLKDRPVTILELGVLSGASLLMWNSFFRHKETEVIGLDMSPPVDLKALAPDLMDIENIFQYQGKQDDLELLEVLKVKHGAFDIVIDDASHRADPTRESFNALWDSVKPGGFYVVEDWGTGFWDPSRGFDGEEFKGFYAGTHTAGMVGFIKQLVDLVGSQDWPKPKESGIEYMRLQWGQCILKKKS